MTFLGVHLITWTISFVIVFGTMFHAHRRTQKLVLKTKLMRQFANKKMARALSEKLSKEYSSDGYGNWFEALGNKPHELPPAYREENWQRNIYGEPFNEDYILASTGCELTDAIYAAAHRANIDIVQFENEMNLAQLTPEQKSRLAEFHQRGAIGIPRSL